MTAERNVTKPPAVFSCRASDGKQEESVESQLANDLPFFAEMYEIVEVYNEGTISGSTDKHKREVHNRLIYDLTVGKYAKGINGQKMTICCRETSRFTRETVYEAGTDKAALAKARVKIHGRYDGIIDLATQSGQIVDSVETIINSELPKTVARHSCNFRVEAMKAGKTTGKVTPYGYARRFVLPNGQELIVPRNEQCKRQKDWPSRYIKGDATEVKNMELLFQLALEPGPTH